MPVGSRAATGATKDRTMTKHKTHQLTNGLLDAAVAKAEGLAGHLRDWDGCGGLAFQLESGALYRPSTDWAAGGPIIDRERIALQGFNGVWEAAVMGCGGVDRSLVPLNGRGHAEDAPTALVAAMRAYVDSKLGPVVSLPAADQPNSAY